MFISMVYNVYFYGLYCLFLWFIMIISTVYNVYFYGL